MPCGRLPRYGCAEAEAEMERREAEASHVRGRSRSREVQTGNDSRSVEAWIGPPRKGRGSGRETLSDGLPNGAIFWPVGGCPVGFPTREKAGIPEWIGPPKLALTSYDRNGEVEVGGEANGEYPSVFRSRGDANRGKRRELS